MGSTPCGSRFPAEMSGLWTPDHDRKKTGGKKHKKFTEKERQSGVVNYVMGLSFITEGAIPFAAQDPLRVIPSCLIGSAIAGGLSMAFGCTLRAPHGGLFLLLIPGVITNVGGFLIALLAGTLVTAAMLIILKKITMGKTYKLLLLP